MSHGELSPTERSTVRRGKHRARSERAELHEVLDHALLCHVGFTVSGRPRVLPTAFARVDETMYLHGSTGSRLLREAANGTEMCVAVTLLDGIVYARATAHNSVNYRSAVIHGRPFAVTDPEAKWNALRAITEHLAPGSWEHARHPDRRELAGTAVVGLDLTEASVKTREGDPGDTPEDVAEDRVWAGVLPLHSYWGTPRPSSEQPGRRPVPEHVSTRRTP
ncbi:pyridoxamine 5'-phosphate oxidase family protein [Actinopolyspora mortivallis]|uniref:pyridoxamine 5'-phosphate oxidase family protein n=1 Tax=Actinopolyspora mortivallis TaxID=33906 RepID=UPI000360881B|nr:pyridoxamine 5'-phosphate oxidase family protein [Actinopolyspora mortivallis]